MDVIAHLELRQHKLSQDLEALREGAAPRDAVARFVGDVSRHLSLQESLAGDLGRRRTTLWLERRAETALELSVAVGALARASGEGVPGALEEAARALARQIVFENEELLPALADAFRDEELRWLGRAAEATFGSAA